MTNARALGRATRFWTPPDHLPDEEWNWRHRLVVLVLIAHAPFLFGLAMFGGTDTWLTQITFARESLAHALVEASLPLVAAGLAMLPGLPRRVAAAVAAIGLVTTSGILTHLTGGYIEAHFHYFVMIGLAAVYVDWLPFVAASLFVIVHHITVGVLEPTEVYNHPLAIAHPIRWAGIHAFFILMMAATLYVNTALARSNRERIVEHEVRSRKQLAERQAAEAVAQARGDFLRHMSHEVRTPLNAILGMANLMARDKEAFNQERVDVINASGQHLLELIQELLDMSHIDAGEIDVHPRPVDLQEFLEQVVRIVRQNAPPETEVALVNEAPKSATLDATRVRQVLINLLGNAIKYAPGPPVTLRAHRDGDLLVFDVVDAGPGIAAADLERIFEPYQQVGPEATRAGAGLGLAISKRLVDVMGGRLSVHSSGGAGTTFRLELPYVVGDDVARPSPVRWTSWGEGRKVLLAEDDPFSAMVASEFLEGAGVNVTVVENGALAVQVADGTFDAILLDARMPVMGGLEASKMIRAKKADVPIIGLSARATADDQNAAKAAGMDAYLTKPLDFDALADTLRSQWGAGAP